MRRRHRWPLFAAYLVVLVVVIDGAAGAIFIPAPSSFRVPHPYYHHGLAPFADTVTTWGGSSYAMITNSLGLRDRTARWVPRRSARPRTVLFGDSAIEGLGFAYDVTVAAAMERRFRDRGIDREILNAGAVSSSPLVYDLKAHYLLETVGLECDEIIVFIDISDIQDEVMYEGFVPALEAGASVGPWAQVLLDRHSVLWRLTRLGGDRKPISNAFNFKRDGDVNVWMENVQAYVDRGQAAERGRWHWTIDPALQREWADHGLELARAHMADLAALTRARGIGLTIVVYPSPVQIFSNDRDSLQVRFWRAFAEDHTTRFVDLFPYFFGGDGTSPNEIYARFFIPNDSHWGPAGHELVAAAVVAALRAAP